MGKSHCVLYGKGTLSSKIKTVERALRHGISVEMEDIVLYRSDKEAFRAYVGWKAVYDQTGRYRYAIGIHAERLRPKSARGDGEEPHVQFAKELFTMIPEIIVEY
jgi:hypothetical protein